MRDLVDRAVSRLLDLLVISKDENGSVASVELTDAAQKAKVLG